MIALNGAEPRAPETSEVRLRQTFGGRWQLDGDLEVTDGAELHAAMAHEAERLYRAEAAGPDGVQTTVAQRLARALVNLINRGITADPAATTRATPVVSVIVDLDLFGDDDPDSEPDGEPGGGPEVGAEIVGAGPISAEAARRLACDSRICRVITRGRSEVLDLGRLERTVTPAQRRALNVRDQGCVFTGCTAPPGWCDGHHLTPWTKGGETNLDEIGLLCSHYHHLVHEGGYRIARAPDHRGFLCYRPDDTLITIDRLAA